MKNSVKINCSAKICDIVYGGTKMLDSVDKKILACLSENSRMNSSAIGAKVNMSVSAVIERINGNHKKLYGHNRPVKNRQGAARIHRRQHGLSPRRQRDGRNG